MAKVALLIGYVGSGYFGLQKNNQIRDMSRPTIEDVIVDGLQHIGSIRSDHSADIRKMNFQRAARTDKGVHAACNVLSLKLNLLKWSSVECDEKLVDLSSDVTVVRPPKDMEQLIEKLDAYVQNSSDRQITVLGCVRACQSFNSKRNCDSRTYCYVLPTYCLAHVTDQSMIDLSYRISPETLSKARRLFKMFNGSHNQSSQLIFCYKYSTESSWFQLTSIILRMGRALLTLVQFVT
ncbi:hypothetical protein ACOME3_008051 [Neoechinorhynchus agilis]